MLDKIVVHGYENPESKDFWQKKHWESIKVNYKKSAYFDEFAGELEEMYLKKNLDFWMIFANFKLLQLFDY